MDITKRRRPGFRIVRLGTVIPVVLALFAGLLVACGPSDADGLTTVTVGVANTIFDAPVRVAAAKGYFRAAGLKVEFVDLPSSLGAAALESDSVQCRGRYREAESRRGGATGGSWSRESA